MYLSKLRPHTSTPSSTTITRGATHTSKIISDVHKRHRRTFFGAPDEPRASRSRFASPGDRRDRGGERPIPGGRLPMVHMAHFLLLAGLAKVQSEHCHSVLVLAVLAWLWEGLWDWELCSSPPAAVAVAVAADSPEFGTLQSPSSAADMSDG